MKKATCVVCCKTNLRTSMHRFASNIAKREQWVNALCSTSEEKKALYERVNARNPPMLCESHFTESDFSCPSPDSRILNSSESYISVCKRQKCRENLGVHFSPTLSFSYHISKVVLKARTKMNLMFKSFHKRVQRDFTRRLYSRCGLPPVSYSERLRDLKFTTLEQRRFVTDIVFLHSIIHKRYLLDVSSLLITAPLNRTLRNGHPLRIALPFLPHNSQSTLASRAISTWNSLESSSTPTVTTVSVSTVVSPSMVPFTPPSTPHFSFPPIESTPLRRPRSTTRPAMTRDVDDDPTWTPPPSTTLNEPDSEYLLVSKESLMDLLRHCTVCKKGTNNLSFRMDGLGFTCTRVCNLCGMRSPWENSKTLHTANRSGKERLPKINVDIVAGTALTATGGTKLRQNMMMSGIHSLSTTTFNRIKRLYLAPAIEKEFEKVQGGIIDAYMAPVRGWLKTIIRRCYHAVLSSNGNGEMASEKFRAILLCMQNQHDFSQDASFKHIKGCEHGPPSVNYIFMPRDGKIVNRLVQKVFTERNIEDIKRVSHRLNTSPCESINALACRYAPKDSYFSRSGHEMRTQETMLHWKHLKHTAADGTRPVVGRKSYVNPTHKNVVWRNVRKAATHSWRDNVKQLAYEVRKNMTETPYATEKKERNAIAERKSEIDRLTRPLVPSNADPNLDEEYSSDEDEEVDGRVDCPLDPLDKHLSFVDDYNLEQTDIEDEDEDEEEE
ncbi:hypothetical protein PRIPAC_90061 [Pristionchus pacificus]|uniref:THAP-type domain-containing protein n=1 Tax=Pristionchus pacificus TaxID=54126 RepID=A0A2A6CWU8_PRIPA|nr:hypothetical protein PRIPAC_90061 [Pristionchus pacificus]|eukprot:PDM82655.1 hypothetical protein PRIPAC_37048 [Pristionchus pacificus]